MNDDRWMDLVDSIEAKFRIVERGKDQIKDWDSGAPKADVEWIVFEGPSGKMKLERVSRFAITDEKVLFHRHAKGSQIERKYSDTEKTHKVHLYKFNDRDIWEELNLSDMFR